MITADTRPARQVVNRSPIPPSAQAPSQYRRLIQVVGIVCGLSLPAWMAVLFFPGNYEPGSALLVTPLTLALCVAAIWRLSRGDPSLRQLLLVGLGFKLVATAAFLLVNFKLYGGDADMLGYFESGRQMVEAFRDTGRWRLPDPFWSTKFVGFTVGIVLLVIGTSLGAASVVFATISYWGQYLFYRSFCIAFPRGNRYLAGVLLFLLPSIAFWTAPIGKDSLIVFTMGLSLYGFVLFQQHVRLAGWLYFSFGLAGTSLIRPHVGAMLAMSYTLSYLLARNRKGVAGALGKMVGVPLLLVGLYYGLSQASQFVKADSIERGFTVLQTMRHNLQYGGSAFSESSVSRLLLSPMILFRPFPWEAGSTQAVIASLEGLFLMLVFWRRRRALRAALEHWRSSPVVSVILLYSVQLLGAFAAGMSNFGTLTRQRAMVLPFLMMLVSAVEPVPSATPLVSALPWRRGAARSSSGAAPHTSTRESGLVPQEKES